MKRSDLEQAVLNMNTLLLDQAGQIAAQQVMINVLVAMTLQGKPVPLAIAQDALDEMQADARARLPEQCLTLYDDTISSMKRNLAVLREHATGGF